jgi:hypothetical protein
VSFPAFAAPPLTVADVPPSAPLQPAPTMLDASSAGAGEPAPSGGADGAPEPLAGEPPLSLFRDRKEIELPVGEMVDRFGDTGGNVAYAARIPFGQRSLPPDWANRPYHLYRVERPERVLSGTAVPWFDQPGGGTAYVFDRSMDELVADGVLAEVRDAPPPPS